MKTLHDRSTAALQRIQEISWTDSLTQISNRAHFGMLANAMYEQCLQEDKRLSLLFIDLDNFKQVNDRHGHDAGDALLRLFAQRAQTLLERHRQQHPLTYSAFARLSGDEFAILLLSDAEPGLDALCDALLGLCRGGFRLEERTYPSASASAPPAIRTMPTPSPSCSRADTAMYQAKAEGKCMAVAFSNELEQRNERIRLIEDQLRALDGDDQLRLVYMPALNRDGAVVSCECCCAGIHRCWARSRPPSSSPLPSVPGCSRRSTAGSSTTHWPSTRSWCGCSASR